MEKADGALGQNSQGGGPSVRSVEEKRQRITANQALAEYYRAKVSNNGSGDTQGLLEKLKEIFESTVDKAVEQPPQLKVTYGKSDNV